MSKPLISLFRFLFESSGTSVNKVFIPELQYGILLNTMLTGGKETEIVGYEERDYFLEIVSILCYMKGYSRDHIHFFHKKEWMDQVDYMEHFDAISILKPEGVDPGSFISSVPEWHPVSKLMFTGTKGEFPLLLSALPLLSDQGMMAIVVPSALLYREGKEAQIRRYIVEEAGNLELVMLLPDHIFHSTGQNEVMLFFKNGRQRDDIMFFDCSDLEDFGEEQKEKLLEAWSQHKEVPGFCASIGRETIRENDYNLNLPRYITRSVKMTEIDLEEKLKRISEIDRELIEIDQKIAMYRRDLELNLSLTVK